jgi:hypothetical protein
MPVRRRYVEASVPVPIVPPVTVVARLIAIIVAISSINRGESDSMIQTLVGVARSTCVHANRAAFGYALLTPPPRHRVLRFPNSSPQPPTSS